jgi:hypothetical protein
MKKSYSQKRNLSTRRNTNANITNKRNISSLKSNTNKEQYKNPQKYLKNSIILLFTVSIIATLPSGMFTQLRPELQTAEAFDPSIIADNIDTVGVKNESNNSNDIFDGDGDRNFADDNDIKQNKINGSDITPSIGTKILDSNTMQSMESNEENESNQIYSENKSENLVKNDIQSQAPPQLESSTTTEIESSSDSNSDSMQQSISSSSVSTSSSGKVYGDFNGDGFDDLAIGVSSESVGSVDKAGGVEVIYGSSGGLSATSPRADQFWTQDSANIEDIAEFGDGFGDSLATGDFNGDGRDDLAIGVEEESVGSSDLAGGVEVIYGSSGGLSATSIPDQFWTQDSPDLNDHVDPFDLFGASLTSGDFNNDGRDDLAIGVEQESAGSINGAGGVEVIYGSSVGLSATSPRADQFWIQGSSNVEDSPEEFDFFGSAVTSGDFNNDGRDDLAIGVHGEGIGSLEDAGGVEVIYGSSGGLSTSSPLGDQFWTQDSTDINDHADPFDNFGYSVTSGDFNGDGRDDLAIGAIGESVGAIPNAGGVEVIYGSSSGLSATSPKADQFWTQDSTDINDRAEDSDDFGQSLIAGDFNGDGRDDLAIGTPSEDTTGPISNAGGVEVIYGSSGGLSAISPRADQFWLQGNSKVENSPEESDQFGYSLASGDFNNDGRDDLGIGVPGEGTGAILNVGGVEVIYGSSGGLSTSSPLADQFWTQDSPDVNDHTDEGDFFGISLG